MKKEDLHIGMILYNYQLREYVISEIGNKYFKCGGREKFVIDTLRCYSPEYSQHEFQLYTSKQQILDEQEHKKLVSLISRKFEPYRSVDLSLIQLRNIMDIISE